MLIERLTWKVNHTHHKEFIELAKAMVEGVGLTPRICTYDFGPFDVVTSDLEFETMEDRQRFWAGIDYNQPELAAFLKRYPDLAEIGATRELLTLH